ncbi:radical SAM protein [Solwaraspora sp. WMMB762]|uniref:radical SAM protein n=1 Tax=Solwaraspora sp. WMMB762 TaxID=3404120 RepID=UPI003B943E63
MPVLANGKIRLIVTGKCNLDCFYCHNEGQAKEETFLRLASVEAVGAALGAVGTRAEELTISGGEPFLHPQLVEIVAAAARFSDHVSLVSNGVLARPEQLAVLAAQGLRKLRIGVDSLDDTKPRPSPGRLAGRFVLADVVRAASAANLAVDLNVVVTRFNRDMLGELARFAVVNGLSIKFFEHVEVAAYGASGRVGGMVARPHVSMDSALRRIVEGVGAPVTFEPTADFGESNLACRVDGVEIRYCRYLCGFDLCWVTGTRIDPQGYVYNCMVNRGLDRLRDLTPAGIVDSLSRATARPCRARTRVD